MTLFVVATPIGNLEDLSPRARRTLSEVDAVVAEDTRRTRALLTHFEIARPLLSLPAFDEAARLGPIVERLVRGGSLALVTDAGTPAVSDPGEKLVDAARVAGVAVVPIPGPCAAVAALSASGLDSSRFAFLGFLPRKGEARRIAIEETFRSLSTVIIYEAGNRLGDTLAELAKAMPHRRAVVARELTKLHEEIVRLPLDQLAGRFAAGARGEVVVLVEGARDERRPAEALPPLDDAIRERLARGEHTSEIARALASRYGLARQELYACILALREEG